MKNLILILDNQVEKELTILITIMVLIVLTIICLTIIKKLKDK